MEVSPHEEIANPQGMRFFAVERHGLPEDFVSFRALCVECDRCYSYLLRTVRLSGARYNNSGGHRERL